MAEHPAELPAEGEGGSGRIDWSRFRGGIGGPNELPPFDWVRLSAAQLVSEVFRLRNRVNGLENAVLAARLRGGAGLAAVAFGGVGGPQELPEGEGGGSGGWSGGHGPWPPELPPGEIAELPISRFVAELGSLVARFAQFEKTVTQQLGAITQRLDTMKR
jgi:hypothetical protein